MNVIMMSPPIWITEKEDFEDRLDAQGYHPIRVAMISKLKLVAEKHKWRISKLKEIASVLHPSINPQLYPDTYFLHIGVGDVSSETGWAKEEYVKGMELLSQKIVFRNGDILFSKIRPYLNKVTLIPEYFKKGLGSSEFYIVRTKQDKYYLWIFLRSELTLKQTIPPLTGSSRPRLRKEDIEDIRVLLPTEDIRSKINEKVRKAEALRQRARQLYIELEKLGISVPQVRRAATFIVDLYNLVDRLDPEYYYYKREIAKILQNYEGEVKVFEEIVKLSSKRINPKRRPNNEFKYVEIVDVNQSLGEIESYSTLLGKDAPSRARMLLKAGNIILSSLKGSLKSIAIVPEELDGSVGTTGFFVLQPNEEIINKESLWWILRTDICQRQLEQIASGAIMTAINEKELRKLQIPIPPPEVQKEIKTKVEEIQKLRREANRLVKEAVKEVEKIIEGHSD